MTMPDLGPTQTLVLRALRDVSNSFHGATALEVALYAEEVLDGDVDGRPATLEALRGLEDLGLATSWGGVAGSFWAVTHGGRRALEEMS